MRTCKVYLAARYSRKEELREHAQELKDYGVEITSSWLKEPYDPNAAMTELSEEELKANAFQDIADITEADTVIFFAEDQNKQPPRGGRHVEFGYAIALGLKLIVIGDRENIFHYLPGVQHYADWASYITQEFM